MSADDAELIELGQQLSVWWAAQRAADEAVGRGGSDASAEAILEKSTELVAKISALEATSIAGLRVKALAIWWGYCGEAYDPEQHSIDDKCVLSTVRDLLRMPGPELGAPLPV